MEFKTRTFIKIVFRRKKNISFHYLLLYCHFIS